MSLGAVIHSSKPVERALYPWLIVSQMVPLPAVAPIFIIWTGFDIRPKVMLILLVCLFPITVNTVGGLRAVDPEMLDLMRTMKASTVRRFLSVQLPAALPLAFSGFRISAAFAVLGAVFSEWVGSNDGLGYLIVQFNSQSATAEMFAVVVILSVIGIAMFAVVSLVERLALPWYAA